MFPHPVRHFTALVTALFTALVISAQDALAVVLPDPGTFEGTESTTAPSTSFEILGQSLQDVLMIVVIGTAVVVLAVIVTRRHYRVAHA